MKILLLSLTTLFFLSFSTQAKEDKKDHNTHKKHGEGFRDAAKNYLKKAALAKEKGHPKLATYFKKMASIKKKAARAKERHKLHKFNWHEYHELEEKVQAYKQDQKKLNKTKTSKKKSNKKSPGDDFRKASKNYAKKAKKAKKNGDTQIAERYKRMAEIKNHAATLADLNKWDKIKWKEYHKLADEIANLKKEKKKKKELAKQAKPGDGFREAAMTYNKKAALAKKAGNTKLADTYERMSEIKAYAAEMSDQKKANEVDWTEYKMLEMKISKLKDQ